MELNDWLKIYEQILSDFGFSRKKDEESAKLIAELGRGKLLDCRILECIRDKEVAVVGGAYEGEEILEDFVITAGKALERVNFIPKIHVTDLEEKVEKIIELEKRGCILVFHAHGDNMDRIKQIVPKVRRFVATTQCEPFDKVYNFGGFTDGDRAVLMAKKFGAKKITLYGFDFSKGEGLKLKKLEWAKKILELEGILNASR
ncbi:MAG: 2-amino-4-hydroxy-6-hydroxymethyldihydropteridine diphosphokinase [Archaeoglobaceae archaeon]|nr:2-amino-4-hydroxy-6-hydroxymethyldihydropteridine diphosphokinase [Archaeoglobaceae archaeon]